MEATATGTGTIIGTDLFCHTEPNQQSNCVTFYDSGGAPDIAPGLAEGSFQIRGAGKNYESVMTLLSLVRDFLLSDAMLGERDGYLYTFVRFVSGPMTLGKDQNGRHRITMNFAYARSKTS